jgi:Fe-S-cluster containining protein
MNQNTKTSFEWKRVGKCNPDACGSFCCKIGSSGCTQQYFNGKQIDNDDELAFRLMQGMLAVPISTKDKCIVSYFDLRTCPFLKNNRCSQYKHRPKVCRDFPQTPNSGFYKIAKRFGCTFDFVKAKKRKKVKKCKRC